MNRLSLEPIFAFEIACQLNFEILQRKLFLADYLCKELDYCHSHHCYFVTKLLYQFWHQNIHIFILLQSFLNILKQRQFVPPIFLREKGLHKFDVKFSSGRQFREKFIFELSIRISQHNFQRLQIMDFAQRRRQHFAQIQRFVRIIATDNNIFPLLGQRYVLQNLYNGSFDSVILTFKGINHFRKLFSDILPKYLHYIFCLHYH